MVMESPPRTFECMYCGWTQTTPRPVGCCRAEGVDHFSRCPDCSCPVSYRDATFLELASARLRAWGRGRTRPRDS